MPDLQPVHEATNFLIKYVIIANFVLLRYNTSKT